MTKIYYYIICQIYASYFVYFLIPLNYEIPHPVILRERSDRRISHECVVPVHLVEILRGVYPERD